MLPAYRESAVQWCQLALGPDMPAACRHTNLPHFQRADSGLLDCLFAAQALHRGYAEVPRDASHFDL